MTEVVDARTHAQILADLIDAVPNLKQCAYKLFDFDEYGNLDRVCVMGNAMIGAGFSPTPNYHFEKGWDALEAAMGVDSFGEEIQIAKHPVTGERLGIVKIAVDLNNAFDWSFERIVSWLRSLPSKAEGEF